MRRIRKNKLNIKKLIIILLIIILITLISLFIYNHIKNNTDKYNDTNLLIGSWLYNEYGGTYVFKEDYTYIQYTNEDTSNNYCKGTYKYKYGAHQDKGLSIRQDENYYYYSLTLNVKECLIMNKQTHDEYTKKMYFGINKDNNFNEITFANAETENIFKLTKVN